MLRRTFIILSIFVLTSPFAFAIPNANFSSTFNNISKQKAIFTENKGQWDNRVLYKAECRGGLTWFLERDGVTLLYSVPDTTKSPLSDKFFDGLPDALKQHTQKSYPLKGHALKFTFTNSPSSSSGKPTPAVAKTVIPSDYLPWDNNYFIGSDESKWASQCRNYEQVMYKNVWSGIDVQWYIRNGDLEFDFVVQAGASPAQISIQINGLTEAASLNSNATELHLPTSIGALQTVLPTVYQMDAVGNKITVPATYKLSNGNSFRIQLPKGYDPKHPLVIDPLVYSTFLGGGDNDYCTSLISDGSGGVIVTGNTNSIGYPRSVGAYDTTLGSFDCIITHLNSTGTQLLYSTFVGGSDFEIGYSIAPDGTGGVLVTGMTTSLDFPTLTSAYDRTYNGGIGDGFVIRLNSSGSQLIYGTYLGGLHDDYSYGVITDGSGGAIVTGYTGSSNFPSTTGSYQPNIHGTYNAFVTHLNSTGSQLVYSTFLGGALEERGEAIASDGTGGVFVTGYTGSSDFPTTSGAYDRTYNGGTYDCFITHLNSTLSTLLYSSYLGGSGNNDVGYAVCPDSSGGVFITGYTSSTNFPTTSGAFCRTYNGGSWDCFVTHLNSAGSQLLFSTYIGGSGNEEGDAIVPDGIGGIVICGQTTSSNFPTTAGAYDNTFNGNSDCFVCRLNSDGSLLLYGSYLGGSDEDGYSGNPKMVYNGLGDVIMTGLTISPNFPITAGSFDPSYNGNRDCFVTEINGLLTNSITVSSPNGGETMVTNALDTIRWNHYISGNVRIELNRNYPSSTWESLFASTNNDGFELWAVTGASTTTARIRIVSIDNPTIGDTSDANFSILSPMTVIRPNGGETFFTGLTDSIFWISPYTTGNVTVLLNRSYPGGSWTTLASGIPIAQGRYIWNVTLPKTNTARIAVVSGTFSDAADTSDANFGIASPMTVTRPNGGETFVTGVSDTIRWLTPYTTGVVTIQINRSFPAGAWTTLANNVPITQGYYAWNPTLPASTTARIVVISGTYPSAADTSDANFGIFTPMTLSRPNGGEVFITGVTDTVKWSSPYTTGTVIVKINRTYPAGSWTILGSLIPITQGYFVWNPTSPVTNTARVAIISSSFANASDTSDANFGISAPMTVIRPNGNEVFISGVQDTIKWTTPYTNGPVTVKINRNYPAGSWTTLGSLVPISQGYFVWSSTLPATGNARIAVVSVSNSNAADTSDANFGISAPMTVIRPNGGEIFTHNSPDTIRWTSPYSNGTVTIQLNRTFPSGSWTTLTSNQTITQGFFAWTPTLPITSTARILVNSNTYSNATDTSDANFTIQAIPNLYQSSTSLSFAGTRPFTTDSLLLIIANRSNIPFHYLTLTGTSGNIYSHRVADTDSLTNANDSLRIWIRFRPDSILTYRDTLRITFENPYNPLTVPITGLGVGSYAYLLSNNFTFPDTIEPTLHDSLLVQLRVRGNQALTGATRIDVSPFGFSSPQVPTINSGDTASFWLYFRPTATGTYFSQLPIRVHAVNVDTLWVSASGISIYFPATPGHLRVTTIGEDAHLNWDRVDTSIHGVPLVVQRYLVYFRNLNTIPWQFLASTQGASAISYIHGTVVTYSPAMYYQVSSWIGNNTDDFDRIVRTIPVGTSISEVKRRLLLGQ